MKRTNEPDNRGQGHPWANLSPAFWRMVAGMLSLLAACRLQADSADVVVYGGSAPGVIAAVQAARMGKSVIIVEAGRHIGGLTAGGISLTETGVRDTIGGVSREFYERIYRYYLRPSAWKLTTREDYIAWLQSNLGADGKYETEQGKIQFVFEPSAATRVFHDMLREAGVKLVLQERLDLKNGVRKESASIAALAMESGRVFTAKMFIDATYEGDLMAKARVTYTTGREANAQYGETLNGIRANRPAVSAKISPYVIAGDPSSGLLPRVEPAPPGPPGAGDARQQAFNFVLCLTNVPENRVPFEKPAGYNPLEYEMLTRWITTLKDVRPGKSRSGDVALGGENRHLGIRLDKMPNRKTNSNMGSEFGSDYIGRSWEWAEADYAEREAIWQEHKIYTQGLLWFLAYDERCPEAVRREFQNWGLARDEFTESGNWPFQLYVREARRMVSDYVMTEHDARGARVAEDPVALASFSSNSHSVTIYVDENGRLCRDPGFFLRTGVFPISYRSIRPRRGEADNLLVPMCLSASHAAYGPVRMEPVFMMLGQAAGTAASLAIDDNVSVQDLAYAKLRERLLADRAILEWQAAKPTMRP